MSLDSERKYPYKIRRKAGSALTHLIELQAEIEEEGQVNVGSAFTLICAALREIEDWS